MDEFSYENLNLSIERLIKKLEKIDKQSAAEDERMEGIFLSLDRLSETLVKLESSKNAASDMNKKINILNKRIENTINMGQNQKEDDKGIEKTVGKVVQSLNIIGQILSAVAVSVQPAVDNIGLLLKNKQESKKNENDLAVLLQPITALVKNMVDEKNRQAGGATEKQDS